MKFIENIYKSISSNGIFRTYDIYGQPFNTGIDAEWEVKPNDIGNKILDAIKYINTSFGMCLGYISSRNILATIDGSWKLCSLNFLSSAEKKNERLMKYFQAGKNLYQLRAPELTKELETNFASDVFTICACFLFLYVKENHGLTSDFFKPDSSSRLLRNVQSTSSLFYNYIPKPLINAFISSFTTSPNERTTIPSLLKKYIRKKVFPLFLDELAHINRRYYALKMIFIILSLPDFKTDADTILNKISFLFGDDDKNIKLLFLNNFILILKLSDGQNQERLTRLLKSSLLCKDLDIQIVYYNKTISLAIIRDNCSNNFFSTAASELYSALKECACKSSAINVQVNAIIALSQLLKHINDKIKLDDIIHQLCSLSTTEPATALSLLGAFQSISKYCKGNIDPTILATVVVPYILKNTQLIKLNSNQIRNVSLP
ncbi:LOW QUALITY PROTEIN: hypothetical protein MXB_3447 [Myxobolus squamalis]|nr:LOW QUALITY PROTEIN: hypothetical protein MXB_3447 [Myxobolus squamalis]